MKVLEKLQELKELIKAINMSPKAPKPPKIDKPDAVKAPKPDKGGPSSKDPKKVAEQIADKKDQVRNDAEKKTNRENLTIDKRGQWSLKGK